MRVFGLIIIVMIVWPWTGIMSTSETLKYSFDEKELRKYIPIVTNNLICDKLYGRIVESTSEVAYEYMFYWYEQSGIYKFATHENDWEFVVVYTYPNGTVSQVNYDSWHYYIGRTMNPESYNNSNVLLYVDPSFHYFKPDRQIRSGNISRQINNQTLHELTTEILQTAKEQVGFDPELFENPFSWKKMGWFGRYTAFDSTWKAFWVVADKKFDWIDLSNEESILTKML